MFCKNCENELPDNAKFCDRCGCPTEREETFEGVETLIQSEAVTEASVQNELATETPDSDTPAEEINFAQASFEPDAVPAKKKSTLLPIIISAVALILVVVIVFAIVIFKNNRDNTEPSAGNIVNVLSNNTPIDEKLHTIVDLYDNTNEKRDVSQKTHLTINISEEAAEVFNSLVFDDSDIIDGDFLDFNNVTLDYNINLAGSLYQCNMVLNNSGQRIIDFDILYDYKEMNIYYGIPSLSDTYLCTSMVTNDYSTDYGETSKSSYVPIIYYSLLSGEYNVSDVLPTKEEINTLIDTYLAIAKTYLENDSEADTTLTVGDISQNVTESTINLTESELNTMLITMLETAKNDSTVYNIIQRFYTFILDNNIVPEDVFEEFNKDKFTEAIDDAVSELKEEPASDEIIFSLVRYINSDNKIIGRKISADGENALYHATVKNDSQYSTVLEIGKFKVTGNGTVTDNKKTGTYSVSAGDDFSFDFSIKDFCLSSDNISGSLIYYFEKEALENIIDNSLAAKLIGNAKVGIELKLSSTEESGNFELNLIAGENILCSISAITERFFTETDITVPSKTLPEEKSEEWIDIIDEDALKSKLRNSPFGFLVDLYEEIQEIQKSYYTYY